MSEPETITVKPVFGTWLGAPSRSLWIPMPFPGLNDIIGESSRSHHGWNRMKQKWGRTVVLYARSQNFEAIRTPAHFEFEFIEPNRRRDPDNVVAGGVKIALDALVQAGLLKDDGWDEIASILPSWRVDKDAPGMRMTVRELLGAGGERRAVR